MQTIGTEGVRRPRRRGRDDALPTELGQVTARLVAGPRDVGERHARELEAVPIGPALGAGVEVEVPVGGVHEEAEGAQHPGVLFGVRVPRVFAGEALGAQGGSRHEEADFSRFHFVQFGATGGGCSRGRLAEYGRAVATAIRLPNGQWR